MEGANLQKQGSSGKYCCQYGAIFLAENMPLVAGLYHDCLFY